MLEQMSTLGGPGVGWLWVISIGILGISSLGIFAACSENELVLKIVRTRAHITHQRELTFSFQNQ